MLGRKAMRAARSGLHPPLRVRAGVAMGVTSLALSASLAVLAYSLLRESLVNEHEAAALRQAYTNARVVRSALRAADPDVANLLSGLQVGPDGHSVLVTRTETYGSSLDVGADDLPRSLVRGTEAGRVARQRVAGTGGPELVVGVPIVAAEATYYEVTSLAGVERTLELLATTLAVAGAGATAIGAAVGTAVSGAVLRPLRRAAGVARRIVAGELDTRLQAEGDRDLAPLADAFNAMLDELRQRIQREARFASDVSHELRGPLAVLSAAVQVAERRRRDLPPEAAAALDALDGQVRSFNALVLDLLEISRFDAGTATLEAREVDVAGLVRAVLSDGEGDGAPVVRTPGPVRAVVDPRRLAQVITNLVDNAERYAGGATAVVVEPEPAGGVRIVVEDDGPGVPGGERQRIFDRFYRGTTSQVPGETRGTGLGLALTADHVHLHGGRIWVEDREPHGARFVVELPGRPA